MRERKKTAVHGTLEMVSLAWKFNSKQLLFKTLNSTMNIIETRAVFNIAKTDGNVNYRQKRLLTIKLLKLILFFSIVYLRNRACTEQCTAMVSFNLKLNSLIIEMRADRNNIQTMLKIFFLASKIIFPG